MKTPTEEGGALLAREFELLSGLRHPNVIASLEYGFELDQPFFTMDVQEDACTIVEAARETSVATKVDLLVQLLHALAYLHRRGLVHRDVKPANTLCSGGIVKLIDLGLAARPGRAEGASGTPAYAAPEVLRGSAPDERADLWAVGVIAYEILVGRHPFDAPTPEALLRAVFRTTPDLGPDVDPRLAALVLRLLARDPAARYGSALEVIEALTNAVDRKLPRETTSTRESLLQSAGLVGRDAELERLVSALPDRGGGRGILVGGESGVGKTRILEELGLRAMLRGFSVLRGQALREGSRPYEPWRGVIRTLAVLAPPMEKQIAALKMIVPDIDMLLEHDVATAPELDPEAMHIRLVRVVEDLLRRAAQPVLIVLEDMQWAGTESLKLFARLQALARELPLLLVGSFRNDERPTLPQDLPGADEVKLGRLSHDALERLCASIVGAAAPVSALVDLVARESGGNAFHAIDVLRSLADEAGALEGIVALPLAERVRTDRAPRTSRLVERLSDDDRSFLRVAAVAGREVDLDVLRLLHPELDVTRTARRGVEAAVLASVQGRFWFAHDKIREALASELADAQLREIHRRLADAIARVTPNRFSRLAFHFGAAGDVAREKELSARAGDLFLRSGAYHEAIPFLRRALVLASEQDDVLWRARLERQLGEALFRSGQLQEARASLASALATLGRPLPSTRARLAAAILREAATQTRLRTRRKPLGALSQAAVKRAEQAILAYTQLSRLAHHLNDEELVLLVTLSALNLAERAALRTHHAKLAAVMGAVMGLVPIHAWARFYFALAEETRRGVDDASLEAFVLSHRGYYEAGIGEWSECREDLERARALYEGIGDVRLGEEAISILAYALFYKGELPESLELYRTLERSGEERVDGQITGWGLTNRIKILVRTGDLARIDELIARADALLVDGITRAVLDGARVELALARSDLVAARREALSAAKQLETSPPRSFMAISAYGAVADALLANLRKAPSKEHSREAKRAVDALAKAARSFPIGEPERDLHRGTYEALQHRAARARVLWQRAVDAAHARELPFIEALAANALGMHERADRLLDRLGAAPARERMNGARDV